MVKKNEDVQIKIPDQRLERELEDLLAIDAFVKVGILAEPDKGKLKANSPKRVEFKNKKGQIKRKNDPSTNIVTIGAIHEFGTDHIPQRSFLRSTFEDQLPKFDKLIMRLLKKDLRENNLKADVNRIFEKLGIFMSGKVKKKFTNNDWEPLADPTRGGRNFEGRATPLVDTGQLRQSISYQVVDNSK